MTNSFTSYSTLQNLDNLSEITIPKSLQSIDLTGEVELPELSNLEIALLFKQLESSTSSSQE